MAWKFGSYWVFKLRLPTHKLVLSIPSQKTLSCSSALSYAILRLEIVLSHLSWEESLASSLYVDFFCLTLQMQALYRIGHGIPPPIPDSLSRDARDFIRKCVQVNPDDRPNASQLLEHPFVKGRWESLRSLIHLRSTMELHICRFALFTLSHTES